MDGNRRWAKQQGLLKVGRDGIDAAYRTVDFCIKHTIGYLSLFAFSLENFKRAPDEINHLFDLMVQEMDKQHDELIKRGIKVCFVGDRALFPDSIQEPCTRIEQATQAGTAIHVNIMFCYGAQQELVDMTKRIVQDVQNGIVALDAIDPTMLAQYTWTSHTPPPDLIIRTGGVQRLSNFLLYQAAYAELYFLPCLWPALTQEDLEKAYNYFISCKRNFGK
jgi:undecaprenyl diphosphate synthase